VSIYTAINTLDYCAILSEIEFSEAIFWANDDDLCHKFRVDKGIDRVLKYRSAGEWGHEFIKAHPTAGTSSDNDSRKHSSADNLGKSFHDSL
jgi:hypothetical protein